MLPDRFVTVPSERLVLLDLQLRRRVEAVASGCARSAPPSAVNCRLWCSVLNMCQLDVAAADEPVDFFRRLDLRRVGERIAEPVRIVPWPP